MRGKGQTSLVQGRTNTGAETESHCLKQRLGVSVALWWSKLAPLVSFPRCLVAFRNVQEYFPVAVWLLLRAPCVQEHGIAVPDGLIISFPDDDSAFTFVLLR